MGLWNFILIVFLHYYNKDEQRRYKFAETFERTSLLFLSSIILFLFFYKSNILFNKINEEIFLLSFVFVYIVINIILSYYDKVDNFMNCIYSINTGFFCIVVISFLILNIFGFFDKSENNYLDILFLLYIPVFSSLFNSLNRIRDK